MARASKGLFKRADAFVSYFDTAFRLRTANPDAPVLTYALGLLFKLPKPDTQVASVLHSGVTQALLSEPGVAQKAFSLLSFWILNGFELDRALLTRTIDKMLEHHRASGVTSDVSWALAFCLERELPIGRKAGEVLASCDDDCMALQALHCKAAGLLTKGFSTKQITRLLKDVDLDGEHWLLGYESVRQGFSTASKVAVQSNPLFNDFLKYGVTFYRPQLPAYAMVVQPGGAPEWTVRLWLDLLQGRREVPEKLAEWTKKLEVVKLIEKDLQAAEAGKKSRDEALAAIFEAHAPAVAELLADAEPYM